jgi:hypothetical protein
MCRLCHREFVQYTQDCTGTTHKTSAKEIQVDKEKKDICILFQAYWIH